MKKIEFNQDLIKIIIGAFLFLLALIFTNVRIIHISLLIISYVVLSYELYINAFKNIINGNIFDENFLMIIATIGAIILGKYDEALMIVLLFQIGEYLSDLAVENSKNSIVELIGLKLNKINLKTSEGIKEVDVNLAKVGDVFVVRRGEKIPLDGIIVEGNTILDTSSLTGESLPLNVENGDKVLSGSINLDKVITIKATTVYEDSTASKIINLIENSNEKKTNTEKFITRFSKVYTPIVVVCAILLTLIPTLLGYDYNPWLYKSLVFLVISCPCALVISVPLGFFMGIGRCSKEGILVKGSNELDNLSKVNAVIFDKTGTITKGKFEVVKINGQDKNEVLKLAAYGEVHSTHPIALSILNNYPDKINEGKITDYKEIVGKGISYKFENENILVGNKELFLEYGISVDNNSDCLTNIYVSKNNKVIGSIEIADIIKEEVYSLIKDLNELNIKNISMLSGDNYTVVKNVAQRVGIDKYFSELLPLDKVEILKNMNKNYLTMFVGDGINDAAVIKAADIGVSMGGIGSDATVEASDIVIMNDNINKISAAIKISRLTKSIIVYNIVFALSVKILMLILGIVGISSVLLALFADVGVTLIAILNTFMILKKKIR